MRETDIRNGQCEKKSDNRFYDSSRDTERDTERERRLVVGIGASPGQFVHDIVVSTLQCRVGVDLRLHPNLVRLVLAAQRAHGVFEALPRVRRVGIRIGGRWT